MNAIGEYEAELVLDADDVDDEVEFDGEMEVLNVIEDRIVESTCKRGTRNRRSELRQCVPLIQALH